MLESKEELTRERIDALRVELKPKERVLQIIHVVFFLGVSGLTGYLFFQSRNNAGNISESTWILFFVSVFSLVVSSVMPTFVRNSKPSPDERTVEQLAGAYTVSHIVGLAMLELGILLPAFALLITKSAPQWYVWVLVFMVLVLLLRFPLPGKLTD
ncbi:MAG: hypothetical protein ACKO3V_11925, partial [Pirellula sp.]